MKKEEGEDDEEEGEESEENERGEESEYGGGRSVMIDATDALRSSGLLGSLYKIKTKTTTEHAFACGATAKFGAAGCVAARAGAAHHHGPVSCRGGGQARAAQM